MIVLHDFFKDRITEPTVMTVGKFDGMHRGHELLLEKVLSEDGNLAPSLMAFGAAPRERFSGQTAKSLITRDERQRFLSEKHLSYLIEGDFSDEFMRLSPEEFMELLQNRFSMKRLVVGEDFRFGYQGAGDAELLRKFSKRFGFSLEIVEKVRCHGQVISSTLIREEIGKGHIREADELLGYPYFIWGEVIHGNHIGTGMGVPTINQTPPAEKLLPPAGVYITTVEIGHKTYHGITDIGTKPTVQENGPVGVETHILDFRQDVYEKEAKVSFLEYLRPEMKFDDLGQLTAQIRKDEERALDYFNGKGKIHEE